MTRGRSTVCGLLVLALFVLLISGAVRPAGAASTFASRPEIPTGASDEWWDIGWPYRIQAEVSGDGIAQAAVDFTSVFQNLGLNHALLDVRSLRVVPYTGSSAGSPIAYAETYGTVLEDADSPQIGWSATGAFWTVNDGSAQADSTRHSQGSGSVKATVENLAGGYGYPGVELRIASGDSRTDWSEYEVLVYDVWPQVNASALDQAPDLYWFKLYNACGGGAITQGGPPLALDRWNRVSVSLHPLDSCWPSDGLDLSSITRLEFHTRDNDTVNGNSGLWDDGDQLTLWFDNLRLVDQDAGAIRWQTEPGIGKYYIYFDLLTHEGHPQPSLDETLGPATQAANLAAPEAGGYYHQIDGVTNLGNLQVWTAPTLEKVLKSMASPVTSAPLRIAAARGEFEPLQLVVRSPVSQDLIVTAEPLTNGGSSIPAPTIHQVDYVDISSAGDHFDRFGPWPDPLWPLDQGATISLSSDENQPLWFTYQVPWNAAPGLYQGAITIGKTSVPVELEVWDFTLPRQIHLPSEWGFSWSQIVEDVYKGYGDWDCYWEMVEAFKQDFIDHRLIPKGVAWPAGLNYPGGVEYDCDGNLDPDAWGEWDFATIGGKYIHGQDQFNDSHGFPAFLALGPRSNWPPDSLPSSFCDEPREGVLGSPAYQAEWTQYLAAVNDYVISDGYAASAYYHIVNEPQTVDDYAIVGQISALTENAAPHLRQLLSEQVEPDVYDYPGAKIDVWMPTITNYEPIKSHERQKMGEEVWWYYLYGDDPPLPNPILMSHPGIEARITPWLAWAERVDGLLHYHATDWSPNPWLTPNVTGKDNGDAFFFYPPRRDGSDLETCGQTDHKLVPSIRWENLRDGMEDYEYLWLLADGDPQVDVANRADAHVAQLVDSRTLYSHVPTDLTATRAAIAGVLAGPTASKLATPSGIAPGTSLTYTLAYTHRGASATLVVTDQVPAITSVITAAGPGSVQITGQEVTWQVAMIAGQSVTLTIRARAVTTPGMDTNVAVFSSTQVLTRAANILIHGNRIYLPLIVKDG